MRSAERLWSQLRQRADGDIEEAFEVLAALVAEQEGVRRERRVGAEVADAAEVEQQPHGPRRAPVRRREAGEIVGDADGARDRRVGGGAQPELDARSHAGRVVARGDEDDVVLQIVPASPSAPSASRAACTACGAGPGVCRTMTHGRASSRTP